MVLSNNPKLYDDIFSDLEESLLPHDLYSVLQVSLPDDSPGYFVRLDVPVANDPKNPTLLGPRPDSVEVVTSRSELVHRVSNTIAEKYGLKAIFSSRPSIDEGGCDFIYVGFVSLS